MNFLKIEYSWIFFLIHFDNLCLLTGVFKPLTFNTIIDKVSFKTTTLFFFLFLPSILCSLFLLLSPFRLNIVKISFYFHIGLTIGDISVVALVFLLEFRPLFYHTLQGQCNLTTTVSLLTFVLLLTLSRQFFTLWYLAL